MARVAKRLFPPLIALAFLCVVPSHARAATITVWASSNPFYVDRCADSRTSSNAGAITMVCDYGYSDQITTSLARVTTDGGLSLGTYVDLYGVASPFTDVQAYAGAQLRDTLLIEGGAPGTTGALLLSFNLAGSVSSFAGNPAKANGSTYLCVQTQVGGCQSNYAWGADSVSAGSQDGAYNLPLTWTIPFTFGTPLDLFVNMHSEADAFDTGNFAGTPFGVTVDFYNSATLSLAQILDSNGNLLPDARAVSTSGVDYLGLADSTPVPDQPATLWLFGTGLAVIAMRRLKRQQG